MNYTLFADSVAIYNGTDADAVFTAMRDGRKDPATHSATYSLEVDGEVVDILKWQEAYLFANGLEE